MSIKCHWSFNVYSPKILDQQICSQTIEITIEDKNKARVLLYGHLYCPISSCQNFDI